MVTPNRGPSACGNISFLALVRLRIAVHPHVNENISFLAVVG